MKKALTQTIIVFVAVNLMMASSTPAQNVPDEEIQETSKEAIVAEKEAEIVAKVAQKEAEIAAKVAQKGAEIAEEVQKQVELVQKQLELQIPKIEVAVPRMPLLGHSHSGAVLVVPAAELKPEDLADITEDMTVMSRIFDNKLSQARLTTARASLFVGFDPFSVHNSGTTEAIYLEGYAALFLMKVNFPLSPTPEAKEEKETEEEDTDPLWKQMRQEIYSPEEAARSRTDERPEEKYDAEKVAELKEMLIKALKHAANIRALKPDQSVILTVVDGRSQYGTTTVTRALARWPRIFRGRSTGRSSRVVLPEPGAEAGSFLPTVLTICAKKSDIDAFAKGELSFEEFRERTKIFTSYAKVGKEDSPGLVHQTVAHEGHYVR